MSKEIEELKKQIDQIEKTVYRIEIYYTDKKDLKEHIGEIWDIYKKLEGDY